MERKQKDRHLETPSEANRDKHINFIAEEEGDIDPADEEVNNLDRDNSEEDVEDKENGLDNGFFDDDDDTDDTIKEEDKEAAEKARREGPFKVNTRIY